MKRFEIKKDDDKYGEMNLYSLMRCNLEDVHLCHVDEDHDLATVVELNRNTLTEDGKREWADVLNAKVTSIYEGSYGVQTGSMAAPQKDSRTSRLCLRVFALAKTMTVG